jgi:hypothetical protein
MPLLRYFAYVGGVLLALLFIAHWSLPPLNAEAERADADRSIIRIHSQHKWPAAVVIDTTLPTIVPPPPPVVAEAPIAKPVREAFALATDAPVVKPVVAAKPAKPHTRRTRVARVPSGAPAYEPFGFRNMWVAGW